MLIRKINQTCTRVLTLQKLFLRFFFLNSSMLLGEITEPSRGTKTKITSPFFFPPNQSDSNSSNAQCGKNESTSWDNGAKMWFDSRETIFRLRPNSGQLATKMCNVCLTVRVLMYITKILYGTRHDKLQQFCNSDSVATVCDIFQKIVWFESYKNEKKNSKNLKKIYLVWKKFDTLFTVYTVTISLNCLNTIETVLLYKLLQ